LLVSLTAASTGLTTPQAPGLFTYLWWDMGGLLLGLLQAALLLSLGGQLLLDRATRPRGWHDRSGWG
jgi:hypothetical protein